MQDTQVLEFCSWCTVTVDPSFLQVLLKWCSCDCVMSTGSSFCYTVTRIKTYSLQLCPIVIFWNAQIFSQYFLSTYCISQKAWTLCWKMIFTQAFTSHSYGVLGNLVDWRAKITMVVTFFQSSKYETWLWEDKNKSMDVHHIWETQYFFFQALGSS
jgi:hypothetical protein